MHEMSYIVRLINRAVETAEEKKASKINKLVVSVGEMTDVLPEYLQRYFRTAVLGTILADAVLEIKKSPVLVQCEACRQTYHPQKENGYACPHCKSSIGKVISGKSVVLEQVELEYETSNQKGST